MDGGRIGLLFLLVLCVYTIEAGSDRHRVKHETGSKLVFQDGKRTMAHRQIDSRPQLICQGPLCGQYRPQTVICSCFYADPACIWQCETDLPSSLLFGVTDVVCVGYASSGDDYVHQGSCFLEYSFVSAQPSGANPSSAPTPAPVSAPAPAQIFPRSMASSQTQSHPNNLPTQTHSQPVIQIVTNVVPPATAVPPPPPIETNAPKSKTKSAVAGIEALLKILEAETHTSPPSEPQQYAYTEYHTQGQPHRQPPPQRAKQHDKVHVKVETTIKREPQKDNKDIAVEESLWLILFGVIFIAVASYLCCAKTDKKNQTPVYASDSASVPLVSTPSVSAQTPPTATWGMNAEDTRVYGDVRRGDLEHPNIPKQKYHVHNRIGIMEPAAPKSVHTSVHTSVEVPLASAPLFPAIPPSTFAIDPSAFVTTTVTSAASTDISTPASVINNTGINPSSVDVADAVAAAAKGAPTASSIEKNISKSELVKRKAIAKSRVL